MFPTRPIMSTFIPKAMEQDLFWAHLITKNRVSREVFNQALSRVPEILSNIGSINEDHLVMNDLVFVILENSYEPMPKEVLDALNLSLAIYVNIKSDEGYARVSELICGEIIRKNQKNAKEHIKAKRNDQ